MVLLWLWAAQRHARSTPSKVIIVDDTQQGLGSVWQHMTHL
jgi:hypothetical protein